MVRQINASVLARPTRVLTRDSHGPAGSGGATRWCLLQHFRGNLGNWDPALIDALASARRVVTFDNAGVGGSSGTTPGTIEQMARDAIAFMAAMEFGQAGDRLDSLPGQRQPVGTGAGGTVPSMAYSTTGPSLRAGVYEAGPVHRVGVRPILRVGARPEVGGGFVSG